MTKVLMAWVVAATIALIAATPNYVLAVEKPTKPAQTPYGTAQTMTTAPKAKGGSTTHGGTKKSVTRHGGGAGSTKK
jgi:hypothetical protein